MQLVEHSHKEQVETILRDFIYDLGFCDELPKNEDDFSAFIAQWVDINFS